MSDSNSLSSPEESTGRRRKRHRGIAAVVAGALIASAAVVGTALPASAAPTQEGVGIGSLAGGGGAFPSDAGGWVGSFYVPGVGYMYCINPGFNNAEVDAPAEVGSYSRDYTLNAPAYTGYFGSAPVSANVSPREAFEISWIVANYGQLNAPRSGYDRETATWAAATEVAVIQRSVTSIKGLSIEEFLEPRWEDSYPEVSGKITQINDAVAGQNPYSTGTGSGSISISMTNYAEGTATVSMSPADSVATLSITGGTFPGGATTISGVTNGQSIPVIGNAGVNRDNPEKTYNIKISGSATGTGSGFSEAMLVARSQGQDLARPADKAPVTFDLDAAVADPLIEFSPVVTTEAPKFIQQGESFTDAVTAGIAEPVYPTFAAGITDPTNQDSGPGETYDDFIPDESATVLSWGPGAAGPWATYDDGTPVPVKAKGTLYGPMLSIPEESDTVPSWAPVAGTATATLNGPGTYTVTGDAKSQEAGYYTWVWQIDSSDQGAVAKMLLPENYFFQDNFAQVVETTVTPSGVVATSKVSTDSAAIGDEVTDTLSISTAAGAGGWLQADGKRIPVTFHGTAYFVPGETAPAVSDKAPEGAQVVGSTDVTATGPGDFTSPAIATPEKEGYMTWVWEIRTQDQPAEYQGYVREWSDQFGVANETTKVTAPKVATKAQTNVPVGDTFHDTAVVTGNVPKDGVGLHFELYEATKNDAGEWTCGEGNLLWTSTTQTVTEAGTYTSDEAPFQSVGDYHWVEVLTTKGGTEISRGACGIPDETTTVVPPKVTTQAQPASKLGDPAGIHDVAKVEGPVAKAGYDLGFQAYKVHYVKNADGTWTIQVPEGTKDGDLSWVCDSEPVFTSKTPIKVTAAGEYQSESFVPTEYGKYLWVETLSFTPEDSETPTVVHRGECGVREETSFVVDVTSQAQERGKAGETATDTAIVNGVIPEGSTIEFSAYKVAADAPQATPGANGTWTGVDVCSDDKLIKTTDAVAVPGGLHENTNIVSAAVDLPKDTSDYKVYWIETVKDENGNVIAHGECGLPHETTTVEKSEDELAWTGGDSTAALIAGGIAITALIAGAGVYALRRRRSNA